MRSKYDFALDIMLEQLAYYERTDNEMIHEIYRVLGDNFDELLYKINDLYNQLNVDTATWGLDAWEESFDINSSSSLSYEERRNIIKTKMKTKGKISTKTLEDIVQDYYDEKVYVYFMGKLLFDLPLESNKVVDLRDMSLGIIEDVKPAHLGYDIMFTINRENSKIGVKSATMEFETLTVHPYMQSLQELEGDSYSTMAILPTTTETVYLTSDNIDLELTSKLNARTIGSFINQLEDIVIGGDED